MALTERRVISQVTTLPQQSAINVQWSNQVLRDGEVISEQLERKGYTSEQKSEFLAEVDNAAAYVTALGW